MYQIETETVIDTREGKSHILSNIDAWKSVSDYLSSTLGPFGFDKMFVTKDKVLITNDGATILKNKKFNHPAVNLLVTIAENQDEVVGDGTTSVVLLASEILQKLRGLIKDDFSVPIVISTLEKLKRFCLEKIKELQVEYSDELLLKIAETSLNSKILKLEAKFFAKLILDATLNLHDFDLLGIKKVLGGGMKDSLLVNGVAFEKCFSYAGYEQQPKKIESPKIVCLNVELEWKAEKDNAQLRLNSIEEYQKAVDVEWKIIRDKLDEIISSGANVVLSKLPIGDFATQYFAKHDIFCAGRVDTGDLKRVADFASCDITSSTSYLSVGSCDLFEERQVGKYRYNFLSGKKKASTIILRGPGFVVLDEMERSLNDVFMVLKRTLQSKRVVAGGGAVEMQLSRLVKEQTRTFEDKEFFVGTSVGMALEVIPFTLATNFGIDAMETIQQLRRLHSKGNFNFGVDAKEGVADKVAQGVLEPLGVKENMIKAAFEVAASLLKVEGTIIKKKQN